jgi:hypothetical protein
MANGGKTYQVVNVPPGSTAVLCVWDKAPEDQAPVPNTCTVVAQKQDNAETMTQQPYMMTPIAKYT